MFFCLQINGEAVVGWNYEKVKAKLKNANLRLDQNMEQKASDLKLLINRRPLDDTTTGTLSKSKTTDTLVNGDDEENRNKLELDFTLKIQPDMFCNRDGRVGASFFSLQNLKLINYSATITTSTTFFQLFIDGWYKS